MRQCNRTIGQSRTAVNPHRQPSGPRAAWHPPPPAGTPVADRWLGRPCIPIRCISVSWKRGL